MQITKADGSKLAIEFGLPSGGWRRARVVLAPGESMPRTTLNRVPVEDTGLDPITGPAVVDVREAMCEDGLLTLADPVQA